MNEPRTAPPLADSSRGLGRGLLALLAMSMFVTGGTIHYQTPLLPQFGREFGADASAVGWVATLTFGGFLAGVLLLAPLGDRFDKRTLILAMLGTLLAAVLAIAVAPSLGVLIAASFAIGVGASLSQHMVPLVADLAHPSERGRAVGTLLSGLFLGILFARVAGGFVAEQLGWRWMYMIAAALLVAIAVPLWRWLPHRPPTTTLGYGALLRSVFELLRTHAELRRASLIQFLLGICYGCFWSTLAQMLLSEHGLGPTVAGLVGLPGAAGVLIARPAGRWMDRRGATPVVIAGASLVMIAFGLFGLAGLWVAAVFVGAALLDCGLRAALVANQTLVTAVDPSSRSRSNTVFAMHLWGGNAMGAFVASVAFTRSGWLAVCVIGFVAAGGALVAQLRAR